MHSTQKQNCFFLVYKNAKMRYINSKDAYFFYEKYQKCLLLMAELICIAVKYN